MTLDLGEKFDELEDVARQLHVPFSMLQVDVQGTRQSRAFFGTPTPTASSEWIRPHLPSPSLDHRVELGETAGPSKQDEDSNKYGNKMFGIASLVKPLIALLFCILIEKHKVDGLDLKWETPVCQLFNHYRRRRNRSVFDFNRMSITLWDTLTHKTGFTPAMDFLLALDGTFMVSEEEFIEHVPSLSKKYVQKNDYQYSNCNHIFLVLLLGEMFPDQSLHQLMERYIFNDFDMKFTILDQEILRNRKQEGFVVTGYRVSANLDKVVPAPENRYLANDMEFAAFGGRSCTNDIVKLFRRLMEAEDDEHEQDPFHTVAFTFFRLVEAEHSLIGAYTTLGSDAFGGDSLNVYSRGKREKLSYNLVPQHVHNSKLRRIMNRVRGRDGEQDIKFHYKGGTVDGFTCSLYVSLLYEVTVVCMANVTGPLDFTDFACHQVLQTLFDLSPNVDIPKQVIETELPRAQSLLRRDSPPLSTSSTLHEFVGVWEHVDHGLRYNIDPSGVLVREGRSLRSDEMRVHVLADGKTLRIFPGEGGEEFGGPDMRTNFAKLEFSIQSKYGELYLVDSDDTENYKKLTG